MWGAGTSPDISRGTTRAATTVVGQEWPRVDAERRVHFRIRAPEAQSIRVLGANLVKGEDGFFTGVSAPQDPGFHYYQLTVDGLAVADPNSESFFGSGNVRSGIEIPMPSESTSTRSGVFPRALAPTVSHGKNLRGAEVLVYTPGLRHDAIALVRFSTCSTGWVRTGAPGPSGEDKLHPRNLIAENVHYP